MMSVPTAALIVTKALQDESARVEAAAHAASHDAIAQLGKRDSPRIPSRPFFLEPGAEPRIWAESAGWTRQVSREAGQVIVEDKIWFSCRVSQDDFHEGSRFDSPTVEGRYVIDVRSSSTGQVSVSQQAMTTLS